MECLLFFLYDIRKEEGYIVRDRFGKKPLYYFANGKSFVFSSDIRSFYHTTIQLDLDLFSTGYFFYELTTPNDRTIWRQIKKLPAGSYGKLTNDNLLIAEYWQLKYSETNALSWNETIEKTEMLIRDAVKKRLVADVPVAAQLSGGIDSSLVVAMMASLQEGRVKTYNVSFEEQELDESKYAKLVSDTFGTHHTEIKLSSMDVHIIDQVIEEFGEPFADTSMLPTYLICREISNSEKVVCGGDGGDELFGGYYINYFVNKLDKIKPFTKILSPFAKMASIFPTYRTLFLRNLLKAARQPSYKLLNRNMSFTVQEMKNLFSQSEIVEACDKEHKKVWDKYHISSNRYSKSLLSSFLHTRLVNDYLVKVDRASMYASLEMRSPFLDKDLASFAATLKQKDLYEKYGAKSVLKAVAEKYFPKDFVHRNKMGFGVPVARWLRKELSEKFKEVVLGGKQNKIEMDYAMIEKLFEQHVGGEDHTEKLWSMYVFHVWANKLFSYK